MSVSPSGFIRNCHRIMSCMVCWPSIWVRHAIGSLTAALCPRINIIYIQFLTFYECSFLLFLFHWWSKNCFSLNIMFIVKTETSTHNMLAARVLFRHIISSLLPAASMSVWGNFGWWALIMMVWNHILIVCGRISFCLFFRQLFPPLLDLLLKCLFSLYTSICLWLYVWKCFNRRNSGCYVFELDWKHLNRNIIIITISWWKKAFEIWYNNAILRSLGCSDNNAAIMLLAFVVKSQVLHPQPAPFGFVAPHIKDIAFTTLLSKHNMYTYIFHNTHFT